VHPLYNNSLIGYDKISQTKEHDDTIIIITYRAAKRQCDGHVE